MTERHRLPGGHYTGWIPQEHDENDHPVLYSGLEIEPARAALAALTTIDLRTTDLLPPVYDQGQLGSCTANSAAGNLAYNLAKEGLPVIAPSRLFIYYCERVAEGTVDQDSGATIRESVQAVAQYGAPDESLWPYDVSKYTDAPPQTDYTSALADRDLQYLSVPQDAAHIVASLQAGLCVQVGFNVYEQFENVGADGIVQLPAAGEQPIGGHAVLIVGITYINGAGYWIVRNSWGTGWGDGGYCYFPLAYLTNPDLASDFWQCSLVGAEPVPNPAPTPTPEPVPAPEPAPASPPFLQRLWVWLRHLWDLL